MSAVPLPSAEETERFAREFAAGFTGRELLLLEGDLGAGKTTFTRGIAAGLGIDPDWVSSPSFTLVQRYPAGARGVALSHVDLYRLPPGADLEPLGLEELLSGDDLVVVEWPASGEALWRACGRAILRVRLSDAGDAGRIVEVVQG